MHTMCRCRQGFNHLIINQGMRQKLREELGRLGPLTADVQADGADGGDSREGRKGVQHG